MPAFSPRGYKNPATTGEINDPAFWKTVGENQDARFVELDANLTGASTDAAQALSTANAYAGQIAQANTTAGEAKGIAQGAESVVRDELQPQVDALNTAAGYAPGDATDAAMANVGSNPDTQFRAVLNAQTVQVLADRASMVIASADRTGVTDATADLNAAIDKTGPGGHLIIPPGEYRLTGQLSRSPITAGGITITATGVTFNQTSTSPVFNIWGAHDTAYAVTGIAESTHTSTSGESLETTTLTVSGAGYTTGDIVKVIADDVIPYGRPGSGSTDSRIGEFMTVHSSTATTVVLAGRLREEYVTNVRVSRLQKRDVRIIGGTIEYADVSADANMAVNLRALVNPVVEGMTVRRCPDAAFQPSGCYGYTIRNCTVDYGRNEPGNGNFGYGIMDNQSAFGVVDNFTGRFVRTAWTDDTVRITANTDPVNYGRTYGTIVTDSTAHGTSAGGFSTHANSEGVTFSNCNVVQSNIGYRLRGVRHRINNCHVDGAKYALDIADENHGSRSFGHRVKGFTWDRITETPVRAVFAQTGHPTPGVRELEPSYLFGLSGPMSSTDQDGGLEFRNATVFVDDVHLTMPESGPYDWRPLQAQNSYVRVGDMTVDTRKSAGPNTIRLVNAIGDSDVEVRNLRVLNTSEQAARTTAIARTSTDRVELSGVDYDTMASTSVAGTGPEPLYEYTERGGSGRSSRSTVQGSGSGIGARVARTSEDVTMVIGATGTIPDLLPGRRLGQWLTITSNVSGTITINTGGSTLVTAAAAVTLQQYQSASFVWTGTVWAHAGKS